MISTHAKINELLNLLAQDLGLSADTLALENGYACLAVDATKVLHLRHQENANFVDMFMELGTVSSQCRTAVCEDMLQANVLFQATDGATLGFDQARSVAVLSMRLDVDGMAFLQFRDRLERFLKAASFWTDRLVGKGQEGCGMTELSQGALRI